jgi:alpha-tubulin suppressor-like RCC1 family protein
MSEERMADSEQANVTGNKQKAYIWVFGKNGDGELGVGNQKDVFVPRMISPVLKNG